MHASIMSFRAALDNSGRNANGPGKSAQNTKNSVWVFCCSSNTHVHHIVVMTFSITCHICRMCLPEQFSSVSVSSAQTRCNVADKQKVSEFHHPQMSTNQAFACQTSLAVTQSQCKHSLLESMRMGLHLAVSSIPISMWAS